MSGLKPYPEYKDSGNPWLGNVPAHWDMAPLNAIAKLKKITNKEHRELLSVYLNLGVIRFSDAQEKRTNATSEDLSKYQAVDPGDFVLNNQQAWRGSVGVSKYKGIVSPAYLVLSLGPEIQSEYANLLFRDRTMVAQYLVCSKGVGSIQRNLYWPYLKQVNTPLPPPDEQTAIARYLDHQNHLINRYIRARRKLITLLEAQKQAIIQQAVTRGLNPDAPMKDSGVAWLGEVPEGWEVLRSKFVFREVDERSKSGLETHLSMSQKFGLIPSSQIEEKRLLSESYIGGKVCKKNDIVLNRLKAHLGVFALAPEEGVVSSDYTILRSVREISEKYFEYVLKTPICRGEFVKRVKGIVVGFWRLYTDDFYDIRLPVPPLEEQHQIVEELGWKLHDIKTSIDALNHEITLIREYRTRLIADVVTGKLDVREAADRLPEWAVEGSAEEPEETDLEEDEDMGEEADEENEEEEL